MLGTYITEWLELALRWTHLTVGVAWIGASFYFNWLENRLKRDSGADAEIAGDLWAIHGGGFYHVQKYQVTPSRLPSQLHWFKWEAYATWFTGLALLALIFYVDAGVYLLDASLNDLSPLQGAGIGIAVLAVTWLAYDLLCRSSIARQPRILALIIVAYFGLLTLFLCEIFSGRGAYIHVGAAIGTIMVLNVMAVIIPSQKALVSAMQDAQPVDAELGKAALIRSRHNNYLTLPVLFIMIAGHYPATFSSPWNAEILIGLGLVGIAVRHYFNVRHLPGIQWGWLALGFAGMLAIAALTVPAPLLQPTQLSETGFSEVREIVQTRCTVCHSANPVQTGFQTAPSGIIMDNDEQILALASRIFTVTVVNRSMPIGNLSNISDQERAAIASWYAGLSRPMPAADAQQ